MGKDAKALYLRPGSVVVQRHTRWLSKDSIKVCRVLNAVSETSSFGLPLGCVAHLPSSYAMPVGECFVYNAS